MNRSEAATASSPIFRVFLFGEFTIERLIAGTGAGETEPTPRYERIGHEAWGSRGPAIALFKLLLCRHRRRAMKDELVEALWPDTGEGERDKRLKNAERAFDAAASVLRRVLRTSDGASLLTNVAVGDGMRYALAEQERLWVDADAFEAKVAQALRAVDSQDALPCWEEAYRLAQRGQFLEDNLYQDWTQARRDTLHGKMSECVYALADLYSGQQRYDLARELLWEMVEAHPDDEDALYRLLLLLERQERYQAAWERYQRAKDLLAQDGLSLTPRTHAAVKRIRKHMTAQEVPAEAFSITPLLPMTSFTPVFDTVPGGMMIDCATWFALKQAEITTLVNQWCGHAQHCDELQIRLSTMMSQLDERQPGHNLDAYQLSRRQALIGIAALALALLASGQRERQPVRFAEEFLPQCAAGIMACRYLMKGQDFFPAEQILTQYLPVLESLMQPSSKYQQVAAQLALQRDILAGILALHQLHWGKREQHYRHGLHYGQLAQDSSLLTTIHVKLADTYIYLKDPMRALPICQEVLPAIKDVSSLTQSHFYVKQAAAYALHGQEQEARKSLDNAHVSFPAHPEDDPAFLYADFGTSSFFMWEGVTLLELARHGLAQPKEAWDAFVQVEGPHPRIIVSERSRIEIVNHQAETALVLEDLNTFCEYLQRGIEGARRLGSARRQQEAIENYWQARKQWPHEQRVKDLAELFIRDGQDGGMRI
jgi:DNA-binding SARP family transcriptional activator